MGLVKGGFLRLLQTVLYALAFCCAAIILGIYSYFLARLSKDNLSISTQDKAIEGLSGAAVLYTIFAVVLTCCLAGVTFFSFLGLVLDVCFIGCMIAIAVMTRHAAKSCSGYVVTPLGSGQADSDAVGSTNYGFTGSDDASYSPNLRLACRLETAVFAVAIIAAFLFLITALMQIVLSRNHKKESKYGPSPANNYTSGRGNRGFWARKNAEKEAELGTGAGVGAGLAAPNATRDIRPSHDTAYTGSTVAPTGANTGHYVHKEEVPGSTYA